MPQRNALPGSLSSFSSASDCSSHLRARVEETGRRASRSRSSAFIVASIVANAVKVATPWDRAVVLRLGKFRASRARAVRHHPDHRHHPVLDRHPRDHQLVQGGEDADARHRAGRRRRGAVLEGGRPERRRSRWPTTQRDQLGGADRAARRHRQDAARRHARRPRQDRAELQRIIDARTEPWGIKVISVEVRDVLIPAGLQDAMSMQAQAERERQARVILGDSERQVAEKFGEAAKTYAQRSDRAAPARDEHALRGAQAERDNRARALDRARLDAARRRRPWRQSRARSPTPARRMQRRRLPVERERVSAPAQPRRTRRSRPRLVGDDDLAAAHADRRWPAAGGGRRRPRCRARARRAATSSRTQSASMCRRAPASSAGTPPENR